jgi:hypothetical protein
MILAVKITGKYLPAMMQTIKMQICCSMMACMQAKTLAYLMNFIMTSLLITALAFTGKCPACRNGYRNLQKGPEHFFETAKKYCHRKRCHVAWGKFYVAAKSRCPSARPLILFPSLDLYITLDSFAV